VNFIQKFKQKIESARQTNNRSSGVDYQIPMEMMNYVPRTTMNKGGKVYKNVKDMESKCQSKK